MLSGKMVKWMMGHENYKEYGSGNNFSWRIQKCGKKARKVRV